MMAHLPYVYRWNRMERKGQRCDVLARGTMNSCLVEFDDGFRMVTSRNAIRKAKDSDVPLPGAARLEGRPRAGR
ncbi:hypothetical protein [Nitrobacter sp.]|uniref:hypothetical protein n=1 Tax=Nitrobacter sp. TaxID=29420 RepID=UPI001DA59687|nr:hypothetical protein [Nitrobacter sp.]MCB1394265.1 hypothetical protein [Nitrobacter sp.]MCV0384876.1 hypothetical protein [Nitrobacter sp.]